MIRHRKAFSFIAATALAFTMGAAALAESVDLSITPNTAADALTASLEAETSMDVSSFSDRSQVSTGVLTLAISDGRGTWAGWNVTLQAGDFMPVSGTGRPIPAAGFRMTADAGIVAEVGDPRGIEVVNMRVPLHTGTRILRAEEGAGTGVYTQRLGVELEIPAWQPVGTYQANMTVTIASGPGS